MKTKIEKLIKSQIEIKIIFIAVAVLFIWFLAAPNHPAASEVLSEHRGRFLGPLCGRVYRGWILDGCGQQFQVRRA